MTNFCVNGCYFDSSPLGAPRCPGVYLITVFSPLSKRGKVFYVGSSKNLAKRIYENIHHPYRILFDRLNNFWVTVQYHETENYLELERAAIKQYKPVLNTQCKNA